MVYEAKLAKLNELKAINEVTDDKTLFFLQLLNKGLFMSLLLCFSWLNA